MRKLIKISFVFLMIFANSAFSKVYTCTKNSFTKDSIYAKYKSEASILTLFKNNKYDYVLKGHRHNYFSKGTWKIEKNILILNSTIQQNDIPVTIITTNDSTDSIKIEIIYDKNGNPLTDGELFINYDTTKSCIPLFKNHCKMKKGEINSLKLRLRGNNTSKWQKLENPEKVGYIAITVNIDFSMDFYYFFANEKFIMEKNKLFRTESRILSGSKISKLVKSNQFPFTKNG